MTRRARRRLKKARALTLGDWTGLLRAWVLLAGVRTALRFYSLNRILTWSAAVKPSPHADRRETRRVVRRAARLVKIASRWHPVPMRCLPQSLTVMRLLARRGIVTTLQLGVRIDGGALGAHAWTEWQGKPITDRTDPRGDFAPLAGVATRSTAARVPGGRPDA